MRIGHIVALTAALLLSFSAMCDARQVVILRADLWCPYNCAPGSDHPGFAIEIAREAFAAAGYDVDYQLLNWSRSIEDARLGRSDGVIGAYYTDVPGFIVPHEPIGVSAYGFAVQRGVKFTYVDTHSLDGRVIGVVATYEFAGALGAYLHARRNDQSRVQSLTGDNALARNFTKLIAGRIDLVVDDANVLRRAIADLKLGDQVTFSKSAKSVPVFIAFSPANPLSPHLAAILDDGIARMRASGRLANILARYDIEDWGAQVGNTQDQDTHTRKNPGPPVPQALLIQPVHAPEAR